MPSISYNINLPKEWTNKSYDKFIKDLFSLGNKNLKEFNEKIIFTKYPILGINSIILKGIIKKIAKTNIEDYLKVRKRNYYEEVLIEGILISYIKEYDQFINYLYQFLPSIDNWALCDQSVSSYKIIKKNKEKFMKEIDQLLNSKNEYDVRVGIVSLLNYYIDEEYLMIIFKKIDQLNRKEYYIEMAIAWLVSIMYIKYPKETIKYLKKNTLSKTTQNKAIQKIRDSKRVSQEAKDDLLQYKK